MRPVDYALLCQRSYTDAPTIGHPNSASRMHVYGDVHCFRGTDDVLAWMADAHVGTSYVWSLGQLHAGFWGAVADILPACLALPRPKAVTGHSLGAAMAIIYAGVLAELGTPVSVYAFEPPRMCADLTLSAVLKAAKVPWYATRNGNDVVTQVPLGFSLPGPLTQIGHASLPFDNTQDHSITRVVAALEQP